MDWLQIENKLDNEIEVNISGLIGGGMFSDGVTAEKVQQDILNLTNEIGKSPSKITVNILNSPGGSVFHALAIHDLLQVHRAKVITNGIGLVASAATIIHQAGGKGNRNLSPNSRYLVHRIQGGIEGTPEEIEGGLNELKGLEQALVTLYAATNTANLTAEVIFKTMKENNGMGKFMSPDEAIEKGFADNKIKTYKVAACINVDEVTAKLCNIPTLEIKNTEYMNFETITNALTELKNLITGKKITNMSMTPAEQAMCNTCIATCDACVAACLNMNSMGMDMSNCIAECKNCIQMCKDMLAGNPVENKSVNISEIVNKIPGFESQLNLLKTENETLTATVTEKDAAIVTANAEIETIKNEFSTFAQANAHTVTFNEAGIVIAPHTGAITEEDKKTIESVNNLKGMFKIKPSGINVMKEN